MVNFCTVIYETKARASTINVQYIETPLSYASIKEDAMRDWVEIIISKLCPSRWVEDEDIRSVMRHPYSSNLSTKTVKNTLFLLEEMVEKIRAYEW